jgi:hypothetical protein
VDGAWSGGSPRAVLPGHARERQGKGERAGRWAGPWSGPCLSVREGEREKEHWPVGPSGAQAQFQMDSKIIQI